MAERKVINKYFPPNFDPSKVPIGFAVSGYKVRLMAPFSMRCTTCGEYIYKGKKFNARKETVRGEEYLGIEIYRFYIRCPGCSAEISFKTDPKNADYVAELGCQRNFESWRSEKMANEETSYRKQLEEEMDPMKALENKTVDSKREVDILELLDEIRTHNARNEKVDADAAMEMLEKKEKKQLNAEEERKRKEDEEDAAIARIYFQSTSADGVKVKRLLEEDELKALEAMDKTDEGSKTLDSLPSALPKVSNNGSTAKKARLTTSDLGIKVKPKVVSNPIAVLPPPKQSSGLSLLANYGDDEDDDE